jgi:hypothetical protein
MFSFLRQKKQNEVRDSIQRILNLSASRVQVTNEVRLEPRYSRSVAVILIPWDSEPLVEHATFALVQDLSDYGARIVAQQPILVPRLLCCFAVDQLRFLLGEVRQAAPLGGGFWQCGISFRETIHIAEHLRLEQLQPMFDGLNPNEEAALDTAEAIAY